jgi:hypothetical protein
MGNSVAIVRRHYDAVLEPSRAVTWWEIIPRDIQGLPGAVTLDVDLGISLAASDGQYVTIRSDLEGLGFDSEDQRLVRRKVDIALYIDFLTEDLNHSGASAPEVRAQREQLPARAKPMRGRKLVSLLRFLFDTYLMIVFLILDFLVR